MLSVSQAVSPSSSSTFCDKNAHTHAHTQKDLMFELRPFSLLFSLLYASQR